MKEEYVMSDKLLNAYQGKNTHDIVDIPTEYEKHLFEYLEGRGSQLRVDAI